MQALVECGCGLDVHQATVVACLLVRDKKGTVHKQTRFFGTTTRELVSLRDWLLAKDLENGSFTAVVLHECCLARTS